MSPMFLLVRGVKKEDKTLAVGIQFMLLRVLGKKPPQDHRSRPHYVPGLTGHRDEWDPGPDLGVRRAIGRQVGPRYRRQVCEQLDSPLGRQPGEGWA